MPVDSPSIVKGGDRLRGMSFTDDTLPKLIRTIEKRFSDEQGQSQDDQGGKDAKHLEKLHRRNAMYHSLSSQNPQLKEPFNDVTPFQTDKPRQTGIRLKARLTENQWQTKAHLNRDSPEARSAMNRAEAMFNSGIYLAQERSGIDIQSSLADGQIRLGLGILHWNRNPWIWPELPERDYVLEYPKGKDQRKRYEKNPEYTEGSTEKEHQYPIRETSKSLLERRKQSKAEAGFPYYFECPDPETFMWVEDKTLACGLGMVLIRKRVGMLEYDLGLQNDKDRELSLEESSDGDVPLGRERDAPLQYQPSSEQWGNTGLLYQLWTRDEFYEILAEVSESSGSATSGWQVTQATKHSWGMPPFAIAAAFDTNSPDPALRYEPALEGLYRLKPAYDRLITLYNILAEQAAVGEYVFEQDSSTPVPLGEDGAEVDFERDSAKSNVLPPGMRAHKIDFNVQPAIIEALRLMGELYKDAEPDVGDADYGATTAAWSIRLQQAIRNVSPQHLLKNISEAIQVMVKSLAKDIATPIEDGGLGEGVYSYLRVDKGRVDFDTMVGVEPDEIRSLDFDIYINPTSASEAVAKQEHGASLLQRGLITKREYFEDYLSKQDPDEHQLQLDAEQIFDQYYKPGVVLQRVNAAIGTMFQIGADGKIIDMTGKEQQPEQVLAAAGEQPMVQGPQTNGQVPPGSGGPAARGNQIQQPAMPRQTVNGAPPLQ